MRVENNNKAFAYRVLIGDYNYLQCILCNEYTCSESKDYILAATQYAKLSLSSELHLTFQAKYFFCRGWS